MKKDIPKNLATLIYGGSKTVRTTFGVQHGIDEKSRGKTSNERVMSESDCCALDQSIDLFKCIAVL